MKKALLWSAAIVGLMGLIFLPIGVGLWISSSNFQRTAERTTGTVVNHETKVSYDRDNDRRSVSYAPVLRFTVDGKEYEFTDSVSSSDKKPIGSKVEVMYQPDNPADARADSAANRWLLPAIFTGVGAVMVLIGLGLLIAGLRKPDLPQYVAEPGGRYPAAPGGPPNPPTSPGSTFPGS